MFQTTLQDTPMHIPLFLYPTAKPSPLLLRIVVAVMSSALALLFTLLFPALQNGDVTFLLFFTAVFISAWYGGLAPGLLATVLCTLLADYFFIAPTQAILMSDPGENARLLTFALEG